MKKVTVKGSSVEYNILIGRGLLGQLGEEVKKRIQPCKAAIVTDSTIAGLYLYAEQAEQSLQEAGFSVCRFVFPAGEASKNIDTLSELLEFLAAEEMTRQDIIVAVGGGVTGDLQALRRQSISGGFDLYKYRRHFWRRWIPLLAEKRRST